MHCSSGISRFTHLLQIHTLHGTVHALDDVGHARRDLPHGDSGLHTRACGINAAGQAQQVQLLALLPDGILRVDLGNVAVALLDGFLELSLLRCLVFARFGGLSVELFGCELRGAQSECVRRAGAGRRVTEADLEVEQCFLEARHGVASCCLSQSRRWSCQMWWSRHTAKHMRHMWGRSCLRLQELTSGLFRFDAVY